jgi:hypothetical protein
VDFLVSVNGGRQRITLPDGASLDVVIPPGDGRQYSAFVFAPAEHRLAPERASIRPFDPRGLGRPRGECCIT